MEDPAIVFKGVNKWFGKLHVLRDIDLSIAKGEVVVVCGPSGSGKSTLIRCVNVLERIQKGDIVVLGQSVMEPGLPLARLRSNVGMVFQQFNLFAHMTVLQNIMLAPMKVKRMSREEAEQTARRCWSASAFRSAPTPIPRTCPAASSSAWPSPARSPCSRRSCCSTSRPRRSTPR